MRNGAKYLLVQFRDDEEQPLAPINPNHRYPHPHLPHGQLGLCFYLTKGEAGFNRSNIGQAG